jgi:hypothetical protein
LYLLAVVEARRGAAESALAFLGQAVAASPEVRAQARQDADFEGLKDLDEFRQLVQPPAGGPPLGFRRVRRGRIDH